jgi:hypothetical protein
LVRGNIVVASVRGDRIDCELHEGSDQMTRLRSADALFLRTTLACGLMSLAIAGAASKATPKPCEGKIKPISIDKCDL